MIAFFDNSELIDIYYALAKGNKDALNENRKITEIKSRRLIRGYTSIIVTGVLLMSFLTIFVIHAWHDPQITNKQERSIKMADDKNQNADSQGTDSQPVIIKPNPDIKPPDYDRVTEGFDFSKIIDKGERINNKKK